MKNKLEILGMILFVVMFVYSMAACKSDDENNKDSSTTISSSSLGENVDLTFSGVKYQNGDPVNGTLDFSYLGVGEPITKYIPNSEVKITDGILKLKLGTPLPTALIDADDVFPGWGLNINPSDLKLFGIEVFVDKDDNYEIAWHKNMTIVVFLFYANKDATVSGTAFGKTNYDLELKRGWNTVLGYPEDNDSCFTGIPDSSFKWTVGNF